MSRQFIQHASKDTTQMLLLLLVATVMRAGVSNSQVIPAPTKPAFFDEPLGVGIGTDDIILDDFIPKVTLRQCYFEFLPSLRFVSNDSFYFEIHTEVAEQRRRGFVDKSFDLTIAVRSFDAMYALIREPSDVSHYYEINCAWLFDARVPPGYGEYMAVGDVRFEAKLAAVLGTQPQQPITNSMKEYLPYIVIIVIPTFIIGAVLFTILSMLCTWFSAPSKKSEKQ